jgi:hypothetical protein
MKLNHSSIAGQSVTIEPMVDRAYPNHSAFLAVRHDWKGEYHKTSFCSVMRDQDSAIAWARERGYIVPVGF